MTREELKTIKRCPFCGCEAILKSYYIDRPTSQADDIYKYYVTCTQCGATGRTIHLKNAMYRETYKEEIQKAEQMAIDAWNTRKGE